MEILNENDIDALCWHICWRTSFFRSSALVQQKRSGRAAAIFEAWSHYFRVRSFADGIFYSCGGLFVALSGGCWR